MSITTQAGGSKQRIILLEALRHGPVSSIAAREDLGILHVAARVMELRRAGFEIETLWRADEDAQGRLHRVGTYVLKVAP